MKYISRTYACAYTYTQTLTLIHIHIQHTHTQYIMYIRTNTLNTNSTTYPRVNSLYGPGGRGRVDNLQSEVIVVIVIEK